MTSQQTIDLHAHTLASDGSDTPLELVGAAAAAGIEVLAVTDHDTVEGLGQALAAGERAGVQVLPGCEVTGDVDGRVVHLLAYGEGLLAPGAIDRVAAARRCPGPISPGRWCAAARSPTSPRRSTATCPTGGPPTCPRRRCRSTRWSRWSTRSEAWWCWRTPAGSPPRSGSAWWAPRSPPGSTASRSGTRSTTTRRGAASWRRLSGTGCWPPAARITTAATSRGSASAAAPAATCGSPRTPPTT